MTATAVGALLIIMAGAVARHFGVVRREDGPLLVRLVINLALPPLIFRILVHADLHASLLLVPVVGLALHGVLVGLTWASTRAWGMERPRAGALILATAVGNTGFFGLPLIAASGAGFSLPAAVMYDALATGVITWTSTVVIASAYGRAPHEGRMTAGDLGRVLRLPPNWALLGGVLVNAAGVSHLPAVVDRPLELLGGAVLPLTMIYAGLMIDLRGLHGLWREIGFATVVRLGLSTVLGLALAVAVGLRGDVLHTVVIMAGMPTAMMSLVLGTRFGLRSDVLAGAVVVTTLLSTLTLPAWRAVLL